MLKYALEKTEVLHSLINTHKMPSYSSERKKVKSLSRVRLFATPWSSLAPGTLPDRASEQSWSAAVLEAHSGLPHQGLQTHAAGLPRLPQMRLASPHAVHLGGVGCHFSDPHADVIPASMPTTYPDNTRIHRQDYRPSLSLLLRMTEGRGRCDPLHCAVREGCSGKKCKPTKRKENNDQAGPFV